MLKQGRVFSSITVKQALFLTGISKENCANVSQEDILHHVDVSCKLTARSPNVFGFSVAQYTVVLINIKR
jgi:hypothetical protein